MENDNLFDTDSGIHAFTFARCTNGVAFMHLTKAAHPWAVLESLKWQ